MATEQLRVSALIPASPNSIYNAFLDERKHSAFTGARATIEPWVGGRHTGWDGYIEAMLVELDTGRRIAMTWRTTDFKNETYDSRVEIHFDPVAGGTRVTLDHTDIPEGQGEKYKKVWRTQYLEPMKRFFGKPGAMKAAIQAASRARRLPIPGVTSARPGARTLRRTRMRPAPRKPPPPPAPEPAPASKATGEAARKRVTKKSAQKAAAKTSKPTKQASPKAASKPKKAPAKKVPAKKAAPKKRASAPPKPSKATPKKSKKVAKKATKSTAKPKKKPTKKTPAKKAAPKRRPSKPPAKKRAGTRGRTRR